MPNWNELTDEQKKIITEQAGWWVQGDATGQMAVSMYDAVRKAVG